ncbi:MAG: hypothetical protein D6802_12465 [Ardenticatenia bacterium]|nr:MAG: hypothetical protein D6802_12465 [Ardenticatenia bacterium]
MATVNQSLPQTASRSFGARLLGAVWRLFKLVFAMLLGVLLGVALWFLGLFFVQSVLIPIQENSRAIAALEQTLETEREATTQALAERDARIAELEQALAAERNRVAALQAELEATNTDLADLAAAQRTTADTVATLQRDLARVRTTLDETRETVAALETATADLDAALQTLNAQLDALALDVNAMSSDIADLQLAVLAPTGRLAQVETRVATLQAAATLMNAQREVQARNFGNARTYLALAVEDLTALRDAATDETRRATLDDVLARLAALEPTLDADPLAAEAELLALWRTLMRLP